ncbi:MAG: hypothetical protein J0L89_11770 [Xanthomonadales bacterium]|nr:hypothetical protein [Xanthomonadales bacterium]MBN8264065.1 hypothetical protein [Xanthomonadales bacterium]
MSGLCGILRLDGALPTSSALEAMTAWLKRRGPEGTHHFLDGPVALGHTLLATTPEALVERLPLTESVGGCTITADLRLDNRDELIAAMELGRETRVVGDGELVLRAYLKWGEDCVHHLLGDFVFALWDQRVQKLFCARDHLGMKPLVYSHVPGKLFAFASETRAVLAIDEAPRVINQGRIADFLENYLEGHDHTSTFFEDVYRLPPAHCLRVDASGVTVRRYWTLEADPELRLESDQAYADGLLQVLTQAVASRLRCVGPIGSMLSGGMDSGSVSAIAARLLAERGQGLLHTLSCAGPDPATCVETRAIHAAMTIPDIVPHIANHADLSPWRDELIRLTLESDEPFDGHMTLVRTAYLMARDAGIKVVLDGVAGDSALPSVSRTARLVRRGRLHRAWREAAGMAHFWGGSPAAYFLGGVREALTPNALRRLRDRWRRHRGNRPPGGLLHPRFAEKVDLSSRIDAYRQHAPPGLRSKAHQHITALTHPNLAVGRERYDRVAAALAIEPRDPFMDLRVIEYCLRLPAEQIDDQGWIKMVLRRAMAGYLPDEVRWRPGKQHLGGLYTHTLLLEWDGLQEALEQAPRRLEGWLNPDLPFLANGQASARLAYAEQHMMVFLSEWLGAHSSHDRDRTR